MSADAQLRLLTSGVVLPLAALHDAHLDVIADAVTGAWACLVASDPALARLGGETEVNAWLEIRLNQILDADPAFGALVASVTRGRESLNVSGSALEKRPDLSLLLTSRSPNFPFTVE